MKMMLRNPGEGHSTIEFLFTHVATPNSFPVSDPSPREYCFSPPGTLRRARATAHMPTAIGPRTTKLQLRSFDELIIAFYTPRGIYLYRHDMQLGVIPPIKGLESHGHSILIEGPRRETDWEKVCTCIFFVRMPSRHGCARLVTTRSTCVERRRRSGPQRQPQESRKLCLP